jgi:hypothetical protein
MRPARYLERTQDGLNEFLVIHEVGRVGGQCAAEG